jgi:hypothetical protein
MKYEYFDIFSSLYGTGGDYMPFYEKRTFVNKKIKEPRSGSRTPILSGSEKLVEDRDQIIQDFLFS